MSNKGSLYLHVCISMHQENIILIIYMQVSSTNNEFQFLGKYIYIGKTHVGFIDLTSKKLKGKTYASTS